MNINTLTVGQCVNWLLNHNGYTSCRRPIEADVYDTFWVDARGDRVPFPFPHTLDGAAKALKQPSWFIKKMVFAESYGAEWTIYLEMVSKEHCGSYQVCSPDELTARYRAAVVSHIWPENKGGHVIE